MIHPVKAGAGVTDVRLSGSRDFAKATVCRLDLEIKKEVRFRRGDANSDGTVDIVSFRQHRPPG